MLNEAVQEAKGIEVQEDFETTIDLQINAYIPEKYIPNEYQKLDIYKRIAAIENREEYEDKMCIRDRHETETQRGLYFLDKT